MYPLKLSPEEEIAVKAFRVKIGVARVDATKRKFYSEAHTLRDSSGYFSGEFDISDLPLPVKKHIITAGIIQGDIFQYGDGYACIREAAASLPKSNFSKTHYLQVRALNPKSYEHALEIVEILVDEVIDPQKKTLKRLTCFRSWDTVLTNEFEIKNLMRPVMNHVITKGIIKGEIQQFCGAVVNAKGSPYLNDNSSRTRFSERPIYLLIQGPDEKTLYWAVDRIKNLIKEAEEMINNDVPEVYEGRSQAGHNQVSHPPGPVEPAVNVTPSSQYLLFMPELGNSIEADVTRCAVLVQWLLAHPLLVSFIICPPKNCESKKISKKTILNALLSLPLYDEYKCTHWGPNKICTNCHTFFAEAQKAVTNCFETVVNRGYDICKLTVVDDYIKTLTFDPKQIGVVYDYPLPLNLFYKDSCRLFIDFTINCGFQIEGPMVESYLRCTKQWYPVTAFKKIVVVSEVKPCPSMNSKANLIEPTYSSRDHEGGLINFEARTILNASPGQIFPPDASQIPLCKSFPFKTRLSAFSDLFYCNKKNLNSTNQKTDGTSSSTSCAAFQKFKWENPEVHATSSRGSSEGGRGQQNTSTLPSPPVPYASSWNKQISQASTSQHVFSDSQNQSSNHQLYKKEESSKDSWRDPTSTTKEKSRTRERSTSPATKASRILRKQKRKEMREKKREEEKEAKKEEINKALETLKEKHGKNSFWTMDPSELKAESAKENPGDLLAPQLQTPPMPFMANSLFSQNLGQVLGNMQMTMPSLQSPLFGSQLLMPIGKSESILKPPLLNAEQILGVQQPVKDETQSAPDDSQPTPLSDVISQLEKYIETTGKQAADSAETAEASEPQKSSDTAVKSEPGGSSAAESESPQEESAFSAIIQQLQQFIDSNQTTSQVEEERKTLPVAESKKPLKPSAPEIKDTQSTSKAGLESKPESSQLKRASAEPISEASKSTKPKRIYIEFDDEKPSTSDTKPSVQATKPPIKPFITAKELKEFKKDYKNQIPAKQVDTGPPVPEPMYGAIVSAIHNKPPKNPGNQPKNVSEITILGDCLLQRSRVVFGGMSSHDIRKDAFTISDLRENVARYHNWGHKLRPYCLLMCGSNDLLKKTTPKVFLTHLKALLNFLNSRGYFVLLVSLPVSMSNCAEINKVIPILNGFITSFHTKPNLTVIPLHKMCTAHNVERDILRSMHVSGKDYVILSDFACGLIKEKIEQDVLARS